MKNQHRSVLILELPIKNHLIHCKIYKYRRITTKILDYRTNSRIVIIVIDKPFSFPIFSFSRLRHVLRVITLLRNVGRCFILLFMFSFNWTLIGKFSICTFVCFFSCKTVIVKKSTYNDWHVKDFYILCYINWLII